MYFHIFNILLLFQISQFVIADGDCGCGVGRDHGGDKSVLSSMIDEESCSLAKEDVEKENEDKKTEEKETSVTKPGLERMILVPAGEYQLGTDDVLIKADNEGPMRFVQLESFYLDKYEVSNKDFSEFVEATGYKSDAETFGDSFVFTLFLNGTFKEQLRDFRVAAVPWWYKVDGASWKNPDGPDSDIEDKMDYPASHMSWNDAKAYCTWRDARLPTEAEWEAACRGGRRGTTYPWGDKLLPDRKHMSNIFQGSFPSYNSAKDGYIGTCPVDEFPPNDLGFHNLIGNVWEWTEDKWDDEVPTKRVKKGGSYLCHSTYCLRYRCSARYQNTEDSSAGNLGFRCAKSVDKE
ncbi:unnamed protein product [Plutella xylostella]|uniref:(diamondback moth) hypothetical protein n=1 Tax=Plutella xylostella TaxID=51655 RepID=A0A8S4EMK5_PLUXY|nr:unnamed protein product [Plutella xylostella]